MKNITLLTVGADVEMFLTNKVTGEVVSSEGITKGSKYDPFVFDAPYFTTSLDNVSTEITIPPARTASQFASYLNKAVAYVRKTLPENLDILIAPSVNFDPKYLQTENARRFGNSLPS